ncbi:hypothetical protein ACFWUU_04255 [Kribbella sp. NPDC058693]|uniref:hypothetical protein n=1 Tax=Kribbella sp. NPDC058693 TaxID=3346602 RepID=UPI0036665D11
MSNKKSNRKRRDTREYRLSVRAVRRETPDINKLARAIIDLAMAQAEAEAQAENNAQSSTVKTPDADPSRSADDS